jgi:PAS domain S-box-containing protein
MGRSRKSLWGQLHPGFESLPLRHPGLDGRERTKELRSIIARKKAVEKTLKESESKYRVVADNTHDWEFWLSPEGKLLYVSPSCERITGYHASDFLEDKDLFLRIVHSDDRSGFDGHLKKMTKDRALGEMEFRVVHADGRERWIGHVCRPVFDEKMRFLGIRGSNRDITERRDLQQALEMAYDELETKVRERTAELSKTYRELKAFFSSSMTPLVFLDRDFNFILVNEAYAKACQSDVSVFSGHNHFELYPNEENEAIFKKVVETKTPYSAFAKPFVYPDHPEWGITYWDWTLNPVLDKNGEVDFLVFALKDVTEYIKGEEDLRAERLRLFSVMEHLPAYVCLLRPDYTFAYINQEFRNRFGDPGNKHCFEYLFDLHSPCDKCQTFRIFTEYLESNQWEWTGPDGKTYAIYDYPFTDIDGNPLILEMGLDITERKEAEIRDHLITHLLDFFVKKTSRKEYLDSVVRLLHDWTGCENTGIRVVNWERQIPYNAYIGFTPEFMDKENLLSLDSDTCACIRVINGNIEPQDSSAITPAGSFVLNDSFKFLDGLADEDRNRFRGNCLRSGYASIAVIPVRYLDQPLGAIHLTDKRAGILPLKSIQFIESMMAPLIGEAINRFNAEEELAIYRDHLEMLVKERTAQLQTANEELEKEIARRHEIEDSLRISLQNSEMRQAEISALMEGSRAVLKYHDFKGAAQAIFDYCKNLVGAAAGYIAMVSSDGAENEVIFLDSGELPCAVDPDLPMPIRGLRGEVCQSGKAICCNDFSGSRWREFMPDGHLVLENVLMAPLKAENRVVGLLGLANKPGGGFTENDIRIAEGFSELASIALISKMAEDALRQSEEHFRLLTESASDVITILDIKGIMKYMSPSVKNMLGYSRKDLIGKSSFDFVHPDDLPDVRKVFEQQILGLGHSVKLDVRYRHKNGSWRIFEVIGKNLLHDAAVSGIVINSRDITERKQAEEELRQLTEELKRSNADLQQFAYAASHDLQEPLRVVAGFVGLLEKRYKEKLDDKAHEFIAYAMDGVTRMQMLIKDLLAFSQVSTKGKVFEPVNCSVVLEESLWNLHTAIEEAGVELTYDLLPTVMADASQMGRLFQNLIGNAIKFRGSEQLKIHISFRQKGDDWIFSVQDNGIGIDRQHSERIFVIFQRLHTRDEYEGTGIGLAICKKIVELHGGRIWVESEAGKGSTFYFTIPAMK